MLYNIKLEKFEGPLDLLLELIENEKMDITEVSLSKVTDEFLKQLDNIENIEPSVLADFLYIAAQLILIKSRNLLPDLEVTEEEEISASELKKRLMEYKRFKDMSVRIGEMYKNNYRSYEQKFFVERKSVFHPGRHLNLKSLQFVLNNLVKKMVEFEELEKETIKETVSVKEKISYIRNLITKRVKIGFNEILTGSKSKTEAVVSFLALLELVKQKILNVEQEKLFGDILIGADSTQVSQRILRK